MEAKNTHLSRFFAVYSSVVESQAVVSLSPALALRPQAVRPVACLACGEIVAAQPDGTSLRQRGNYAIVAEWRTCACGACVRSERVARLASTVVGA